MFLGLKSERVQPYPLLISLVLSLHSVHNKSLFLFLNIFKLIFYSYLFKCIKPRTEQDIMDLCFCMSYEDLPIKFSFRALWFLFAKSYLCCIQTQKSQSIQNQQKYTYKTHWFLYYNQANEVPVCTQISTFTLSLQSPMRGMMNSSGSTFLLVCSKPPSKHNHNLGSVFMEWYQTRHISIPLGIHDSESFHIIGWLRSHGMFSANGSWKCLLFTDSLLCVLSVNTYFPN